MDPPSATIVSRERLSSATPTSIALPTDVHLNNLQPRATPTSSSCPPNTLVVQLSTALVIPDYNRFYAPIAIQTFLPTFTSLADGSLLTPPFKQDITDSNLSLLVTGALAMIFARNIIVSGDYIRRGKVKKKTLFYVLFLSQILSPLAFIPIISSYFSQTLHCTIVIVLSCVSGTTSLALLITGVLGVKVYRCLNNSWLVLIIIALFQVASTAVVVLDVIATKGIRRLTGSCIRSDDLRFTRYFVIIQFLESLFICCCFIYVCWKSRGSPAARGRISIELSMDELPIEIPDDPPEKAQPTRRGWWDYVSEPTGPQQTAGEAQAQNRKDGMFQNLFSRTTDPRQQKAKSPKKRSKLLGGSSSEKHKATNPLQDGNLNQSRHSFAPSHMSRFSRLMPRMELFQEVMKDELLYTTFFTSTCVIVAVLAIIGVNFKNGLSVTGWIALNWAIISLLAIHSVGRVVHRHEREALLQHPVTCTAVLRAAKDGSVPNKRRTTTPPSLPRQARSLRVASATSTVNDNPFADSQSEQPTKANNPFASALDDQVLVRDRSSNDNDFSSTVVILRSHPDNYGSTAQFAIRNIPPSPQDLDFPTSTLGTPVVPVSDLEMSRQQELYQSWILPTTSTHSSYSQASASPTGRAA